jgi:hypothetical protein
MSSVTDVSHITCHETTMLDWHKYLQEFKNVGNIRFRLAISYSS